MEFDKVIKERRSIRKYQPNEISKNLLEEVLETALWAPSGMNKQDWELVVVRGKERDRLLEIVSKSQEHILPHLKELFPENIITDKELVSIIPIGYPDQSPPAPPRKEGVIKWVGF